MGEAVDCQDAGVNLPQYGWHVRFNHKFAEKRNQNIVPRLTQLPQFVGLGLRYLPWYIGLRLQHKRPTMDGLKPLRLQQIYGVPLGGIGGGTIGRGFKGEFCRFQLYPGIYEHRVVKTDAFLVSVRKAGTTVYQQVLSVRRPKKTLSAWKWGFPVEDGEYFGLYPRSWTVYHLKEVNVKLVCQQVSPVIPHNYKDSCLPVGVFRWTIYNESNDDLKVTICLSFKNGTGSKKDSGGGRWNEAVTMTESGVTVTGVLLHQEIRGVPCTVGVFGNAQEGVDVSYVTNLNPMGNGKAEWDDLKENGGFTSRAEECPKTNKGQETACIVGCGVEVLANGTNHLETCLAWDMPVFSFRCSQNGPYQRRYTRWFGSDGKAAPRLASYAFRTYETWIECIENWQAPILNSSSPEWYKSAIFNELYFVSDGGSVWIENTEHKGKCPIVGVDIRDEYGKFAYLEGHEYKMFNTYDVHFYASFALITLWPNLQLSLQYDMGDYIVQENHDRKKFLMTGSSQPRKIKHTVPHDIGDPGEAPWEIINSYFVHNTDFWRDLNLKFVLQVYRDYVFTKNEDYLKTMWPLVKILMEKCLTWDTDDDGLIENGGCADQTYDTWVMTGPSAYCGGLWLASLCVAIKMAEHVEETAIVSKYTEVLQKGIENYHSKLWNGRYYKFDNSRNRWSDSVMADQLCGHWYLRTCGIAYEVFPKENVLKALETIYSLNVKGFKNGTMGAVNSVRPNGKLDLCTIQAEEVWTGVTYSLACLMVHEGLLEEAFTTAEGIYESVYNRLGMAYQTPEALHPDKHVRSLGYMRPLSIWSIQCALDVSRTMQS